MEEFKELVDEVLYEVREARAAFNANRMIPIKMALQSECLCKELHLSIDGDDRIHYLKDT